MRRRTTEGLALYACLDAARAGEFDRLENAIARRAPLPEGVRIENEIFALGMQAAWLRLSKGELIVPPRPCQRSLAMMDEEPPDDDA